MAHQQRVSAESCEAGLPQMAMPSSILQMTCSTCITYALHMHDMVHCMVHSMVHYIVHYTVHNAENLQHLLELLASDLVRVMQVMQVMQDMQDTCSSPLTWST